MSNFEDEIETINENFMLGALRQDLDVVFNI